MPETSFAECRRQLAAVAERPFAGLGRGCHVYGAGGFGRRIARELMRLDQPVLGFVDRAGRERPVVDGLPCRHPDDLGDAEVDGAVYVHGLMNHYAPSAAVAHWAAARGFAQVSFPADLFGISGFSLENYWLASSETTLDSLAAIEALHDAFFDDESRTLLRTLLDYRLSTDPRRHPDVFMSEAYVPKFLPIFERPITFVDGGAYTGDTLEALLANGVSVADWIAFEPDGGNMTALIETARRLRGSIGGYTLMKAGLSDANGIVRFAEGGGEASRVVGAQEAGAQEAGAADISSTEIAVVKLDDTLTRSGEIYVKLDIEGAERDALRGMAELLARRPTLAVSVYHRPSDLWEIPRAMAALYDRPRFRLRQHGHHGFDTVLYVTPD